MSKKRKLIDDQQKSEKKTKLPDTSDEEKLERDEIKQHDESCKPYLPERYLTLYKQFCNLDTHLGMFHQKGSKQSFEEAQKYLERSTHREFKEYHLGCYELDRSGKELKLHIWITNFDKISRIQLMTKEIPRRKEEFKNILLNYLSEKNKEYCSNNNMRCLETLWNPFFNPNEVPFPEPIEMPKINKPSLKPSINKTMISLEEEITEEEKKMKDKIEIPELLKDYSEEFKQKYIRDQIRIKCNERYASRRKEIEDNNMMLKIMDIIQTLAMDNDTVNVINTLCLKIQDKLNHAKTVEFIKKNIIELCEIVPEWGTIIEFNGKQIFKCIDARNKNGNREKVSKIIKERNDKLN